MPREARDKDAEAQWAGEATPERERDAVNRGSLEEREPAVSERGRSPSMDLGL